MLEHLTYLARASQAILTQPREGVERVLERIAEWRESDPSPWPRNFEVNEEWEEQLHKLIGAVWPCAEEKAFEGVWDAALRDLADQGLRIGRGVFGGWDDGDVRLGRAAWCLVRHLHPEQTIETGVARGLTTRVLLEALERNGRGHLWSIDLPPLLERDLAEEVGVAVPERLHGRWTLVPGSSRRVLRGLLADLGEIDLFLHDSIHTTRNVGFELSHIWPALAHGGAALIDDIEKNVATDRFLEVHPHTAAAVTPASDGAAAIACLVKPRIGAQRD